MSKRTSEKKIGETKNKKLKKELTLTRPKQKLLIKLLLQSTGFLDDQTEGGDSTGGITALFE